MSLFLSSHLQCARLTSERINLP